MLTRLTARFEVLTPLFLGGADGGAELRPASAELRPASFKGALRHWYRAIDPAYQENESLFFGSTKGQSPVLLRIPEPPNRQPISFPNRFELNRFNIGTGPKTRNGVLYMGYTLALRGNEPRRAIPPGTKFDLVLTVPRPERLSRRARRAWLAALWLLGHLGSLGTRSRRGFGSLALTQWGCEDSGRLSWQDELEALPTLERVRTPDQWFEKLILARDTFQEWFGAFPEDVHHPHLGSKAQVVVVENHSTGRDLPANLAWAAPIQTAGLLMQEFRAAREPDRTNVKNHLLWRSGRGGQQLRTGPERGAFGLPLTFRFIKPEGLWPNSSDLLPVRPGTSGQEAGGRHPSNLLIRAVPIGGELRAAMTLLDGMFPGEGGVIERSEIKKDLPQGMSPTGRQILDQFMAEAGRSGELLQLGRGR